MPTLQRPLDGRVSPANITTLEHAGAGAAVDLFRRVVEDLPYYNEIAKRSELAKYQPATLQRTQATDPESALVARIEGQLVGFCFSNFDDGLIWLSWFGVEPRYRRLGVGAALLEALVDRAKHAGSHKIWCDSRTTNEASAKLLQKSGFQQICVLRSHWYGQDFMLWERFVE